jgi:hypothetical protein
VFTMEKYRGPTSFARVAETCAVCYELNFFHVRTFVPLDRTGRSLASQKHFCIFLFYFLKSC